MRLEDQFKKVSRIIGASIFIVSLILMIYIFNRNQSRTSNKAPTHLLAFTLQEDLSQYIGLDCSKDNCGYSGPEADKIKVFKNTSGLATFQVRGIDGPALLELRKQFISQIDQFLRIRECYQNPRAHISKALVENYEKHIFPEVYNLSMQNVVNLFTFLDAQTIKEKAKLFCDQSFQK